MMIRNFRAVLCAALVTVAAAAGCSSGSGSTPKLTGTSANITLAVVPSVNNTPAYIAQYDGFFAQQGLNVTIKSMPSSAVAIADQISGKVAICAGAYLPYITKQAKGVQFKILAEGSTMGAQDRVLLVRPGSTITSLKQLVGKTVGLEATNSVGTLLTKAALQEAGVNPAQVNFKTNAAGFKTMAKALAAGSYDAAFFGEPYSTQAQEQYGDTVLATLGQGSTTALPFSGFTATRQWVDQNPDTAAAFVRAIEQAQLVAATNSTALRSAIDKSDSLKPIVGEVIALPGFPIGPINVARMQRVANAMLEFGELPAQYSKVVTDGSLVNSMIDPALQSVISNSGTSAGT